MGLYETSLLWKINSNELPTNKAGSLAELRVLLRKLKKNSMLFDHNMMKLFVTSWHKELLKKSRMDNLIRGNSTYLLHKAVIREMGENTRVRILFDASAREHNHCLSLNEVGCALQNNICFSEKEKDMQCCKRFLSNRVKKINKEFFMSLRHIPSQEKPANLGSKGCKGGSLTEPWRNGPNWLMDLVE